MKIKNNSTYLNASGLQKATYDFYSGNDAEIKLRQEDEWYMRIYFEGSETFRKGGYVIFDTFTYDDDHLPRLKDYFDDEVLTATDEDGNEKYFGNYGCFNRLHFPKFMKDLRAALQYAGYDVKNNLKFLYTTEYGHDGEYTDDRGRSRRGTMRPHYHLMLFVTDPRLDRQTLNEFVGKYWKYGFHDNGKSPAELSRNTFHSGLGEVDRKVRLRGLANYIGKYMHKDADYEKVIGSRIDAIAYKMCPEPTFDTQESKDINVVARKNKKLVALLTDEQKACLYADKDLTVESVLTDEQLKKVIFTPGRGRNTKPKSSYTASFKTRQDWLESWRAYRKMAYDKIATFHGQSQHFGECALTDEDFDVEEVAKTGKMRIPDSQKGYKFIPIPMYYRRKLFYEQVMKDDGKLMWRLKDDELSKKFYVNKSYRQAAVMANIYRNVYTDLKVADRIKVDSWMRGRNWNDLAIYDVFFKDCLFDCDLTDIQPADTIEIRLSQDFTSLKVNGNELNAGQPLSRITQDCKEEFKHFDEVLRVFEPYLDERHNTLNESYNKKNELRKKMRNMGLKTKK